MEDFPFGKNKTIVKGGLIDSIDKNTINKENYNYSPPSNPPTTHPFRKDYINGNNKVKRLIMVSVKVVVGGMFVVSLQYFMYQFNQKGVFIYMPTTIVDWIFYITLILSTILAFPYMIIGTTTNSKKKVEAESEWSKFIIILLVYLASFGTIAMTPFIIFSRYFNYWNPFIQMSVSIATTILLMYFAYPLWVRFLKKIIEW